MKVKLLRVLLIGVILAVAMMAFLPQMAMAQTIVDSSTYAHSLLEGFYQHSFYANGKHWIVYHDGSNIVLRTSSDNGSSWSGETIVRAGSLGDNWKVSVKFDGTYAHYVCAAGGILYYRRFTPNADGTVTYSAAEQNTGLSTNSVAYNIGIDTNGYPYIAYEYESGYPDDIIVSKSSTNDGTWSTAWSEYMSTTVASGAVDIVQLTSGKMACIWNDGYGASPTNIKVKRWTGSAWGSTAIYSTTVSSRGITAIPEDDNVHIAWFTGSNMYYMRWQYSTNTYDSTATLQTGGFGTYQVPVMTIDETGSLHVFWDIDASNTVHYITKPSGGSWSSVYTLVTDVDGISGSQTCQDLAAHPSANKENIGVFYMAAATIMKFKYLDEVFEVTTLPASGVGNTYATLRGEIVSLSFGSATTRGFFINTSATLIGAAEHSETGLFNVGVFNHTVDGLISSTDYWYIAFAENEFGRTYGDWVSFTTVFGMPTLLNAVPISSSKIALYWEYTGNVEGYCITIKRDTGGYPTDILDGTLVLNKTVGSETEDTHNNSGLSSGTSYYYTLWLYDCDTGEQGGNASDWATTFASGTSGGITDPDTGLPYPTPAMPDEWFQAPSCAMYGQIPFMSWIEGVADSFSMPDESLCVAITFLGIIAISFVSFKLIPLGGVAMLVAGVLILIASIAGAIPMYFIALALVLMGGSLFLWHRA